MLHILILQFVNHRFRFIVQTNPLPLQLTLINTQIPVPTITAVENKKLSTPLATGKASEHKSAHQPVPVTKVSPSTSTPIYSQQTESRTGIKIKPNWYVMSRDYIRRQSENERQLKLQQDKLWMKTHSVMFEPAVDLFKEQDINAMLGIEEYSLVNIQQQEFKGLGFTLGDSCFVGFQAVTWETYEKAAREQQPVYFSFPFNCKL